MSRSRHSRLLTAPLLLATCACGQELRPQVEKNDRQLPAVSLLPEGSTLQGVMLPRYDEQQRLLAVLRAKHMKVINSETVDGTEVRIDLHRAEGGHRGSIDLAKATLDQAHQLLRATEDVLISSADMATRGTGLVYSLENGRGFLLGPVVTRFHPPPPDTSMNTPIRRSTPTTGRWASILTTAACLPLIAAPAPLNEAQLATIDQQLAPATPVAGRHAQSTEELTELANQKSESTDRDLGDFLQAVGLTSLLAEPAAAPEPAAEPPAITPKPGDTSVDCDGGMYFDTEAGVLVYLDNIRLRDERFKLDCSKELKIFLEQQEKKAPAPESAKPGGQPAPDKAPEKTPEKSPDKPSANKLVDPAAADLFGGGKFGDIKQIVASGSVKVTRKDKSGKDITASAESAIFDGKTGDVILRGGFPAIRQGGSSLVALEPGLYIRLYQNGDIYAQPGRWRTIADNLGEAKPGKPGNN